MPGILAGRNLAAAAHDLAGFGVPPSAYEILAGGDNQITLVFATRIRPGQEIAFRFVWPPSLTGQDGKSRGAARLSVISTPPLDTRFGSEFVRVNIDAAPQCQRALNIGSSALRVARNARSGRGEGALAQQREARAAEHRALEHLQPADLPLHRTRRPGRRGSCRVTRPCRARGRRRTSPAASQPPPRTKPPDSRPSAVARGRQSASRRPRSSPDRVPPPAGD